MGAQRGGGDGEEGPGCCGIVRGFDSTPSWHAAETFMTEPGCSHSMRDGPRTQAWNFHVKAQCTQAELYHN